MRERHCAILVGFVSFKLVGFVRVIYYRFCTQKIELTRNTATSETTARTVIWYNTKWSWILHIWEHVCGTVPKVEWSISMQYRSKDDSKWQKNMLRCYFSCWRCSRGSQVHQWHKGLIGAFKDLLHEVEQLVIKHVRIHWFKLVIGRSEVGVVDDVGS